MSSNIHPKNHEKSCFRRYVFLDDEHLCRNKTKCRIHFTRNMITSRYLLNSFAQMVENTTDTTQNISCFVCLGTHFWFSFWSTNTGVDTAENGPCNVSAYPEQSKFRTLTKEIVFMRLLILASKKVHRRTSVTTVFSFLSWFRPGPFRISI